MTCARVVHDNSADTKMRRLMSTPTKSCTLLALPTWRRLSSLACLLLAVSCAHL